jgi:hypothetical protein
LASSLASTWTFSFFFAFEIAIVFAPLRQGLRLGVRNQLGKTPDPNPLRPYPVSHPLSGACFKSSLKPAQCRPDH